MQNVNRKFKIWGALLFLLFFVNRTKIGMGMRAVAQEANVFYCGKCTGCNENRFCNY